MKDLDNFFGVMRDPYVFYRNSRNPHPLNIVFKYPVPHIRSMKNFDLFIRVGRGQDHLNIRNPDQLSKITMDTKNFNGLIRDLNQIFGVMRDSALFYKVLRYQGNLNRPMKDQGHFKSPIRDPGNFTRLMRDQNHFYRQMRDQNHFNRFKRALETCHTAAQLEDQKSFLYEEHHEESRLDQFNPVMNTV